MTRGTLCPRCREHGVKTVMIYRDGHWYCGRCGYVEWKTPGNPDREERWEKIFTGALQKRLPTKPMKSDEEKVIEQIVENCKFWKSHMCKRETAEKYARERKGVARATEVINDLIRRGILYSPRKGYIAPTEPEKYGLPSPQISREEGEGYVWTQKGSKIEPSEAEVLRQLGWHWTHRDDLIQRMEKAGFHFTDTERVINRLIDAKKIVVSPSGKMLGRRSATNRQIDLRALANEVPDVDDPARINYWKTIDNKQIYLEGWCDKCYAGTGIGYYQTDAKINYAIDLTPRILKKKAAEKGLKLLKGRFIETPEKNFLVGVTVGVYTKKPTL